MDLDIFYPVGIVGCVGVLYLICLFSFAKIMLGGVRRVCLLKRMALSVGLFMGALVLCLLVLDVGDMQSAFFTSLSTLALSLILFALLSKRWEADEASQEKVVAELTQTVSLLKKNLSQSVSSEVLCAQAAKKFDLTRREEEMLLLLNKGLSYSEIAQRLYISPNTVKTHIRGLYKKMGAEERSALKNGYRG